MVTRIHWVLLLVLLAWPKAKDIWTLFCQHNIFRWTAGCWGPRQHFLPTEGCRRAEGEFPLWEVYWSPANLVKSQCRRGEGNFYRTQVYLGSNLWVRVSLTGRWCLNCWDVYESPSKGDHPREKVTKQEGSFSTFSCGKEVYGSPADFKIQN